jgi:uncharacterized protein YndB with AHSA1/START domain
MQMAEIRHRVGVVSPTKTSAEVYQALTTIDGLAGWWTTDTTGDPEVGGKIHFQFGDRGFFDMEVVELVPGSRVRWRVVDGPPEWIGTTVTFDLEQQDEFTVVLFAHEGWAEPVEFMHHCSTKWGVFLMSLKRLVETGQGEPHPDDVLIDNWG